MASMTNYLENKIIDWFYRGLPFTPPSGLYIALFTAAPSDAGGGVEVVGGAYGRQNLPPSITNWSATNGSGSTASPSTGTGGTTSNNVVVTFPTATANWGTVTHVGMFDAVAAGNMLYWGLLNNPMNITTGGIYYFDISQLSYQIDN